MTIANSLLQTELATSTDPTGSNIHYDVANTHTAFSDVHCNPSNANVISDVRHNVSNTYAVVSDIDRNTSKTREEPVAQNLGVSASYTLPVPE